MATNTGDDRRSEELETNVKEGISVIVEFCLRRLVEMGQVSKEQLKHRVRIDWNSSRQLRALGLAAATTENDSGVAVLKVDTSLPLPSLVWAIPHEAVHIAQTCRGDLRHLPGRNSIWKGEHYRTLDGEDAGYFQQPWEAEARFLESVLRDAIREEYPDLGKLLPTAPSPEDQSK